jgi:hypothetical protein
LLESWFRVADVWSHRSVIPSTMKPFRIVVDVGGLGPHLNLEPTISVVES